MKHPGTYLGDGVGEAQGSGVLGGTLMPFGGEGLSPERGDSGGVGLDPEDERGSSADQSGELLDT